MYKKGSRRNEGGVCIGQQLIIFKKNSIQGITKQKTEVFQNHYLLKEEFSTAMGGRPSSKEKKTFFQLSWEHTFSKSKKKFFALLPSREWQPSKVTSLKKSNVVTDTNLP